MCDYMLIFMVKRDTCLYYNVAETSATLSKSKKLQPCSKCRSILNVLRMHMECYCVIKNNMFNYWNKIKNGF